MLTLKARNQTLKKQMPTPARILLFVAAIAAMLAAVSGGLVRLGAPIPGIMLAVNHGPLMICGLFGTLISLERAVAMGRRWPYLAPMCSALAVACLLAGFSQTLAIWLFVAAAFILTLGSVWLWMQQHALHIATLAVAAGMWLLGNLIWLANGFAMPAIPAWQAFLVLTIAGERLELSRLLPTPAYARKLFAVVLAGIVLGALLPRGTGVVSPLFACSLLALALWLLRYDIVRRTLQQAGLPRYIAVCLGSGYLWLLAAAGLMLASGTAFPWLRDAALHALLLGFVIAMVFGHAPIVLPSITRLRLPYHPALYLPLALLHVSLGVRVYAGLANDFALRGFAAWGNAAALATFAVTAAILIRKGKSI